MTTNGKEKAEVLDAEFVEETAMKVYQHEARELALTPVVNLQEARKRLKELQEFVKEYLIEGEDYGIIPGTKKPTLYKPGADKLCDIYGLADKFHIINKTEDWNEGLFDYEIECTLLSKRTGQLVGSGLGSCSSYEAKYRWRDQKRKCPKCGKEAIIVGKVEFGGGFVCWKKADGCGANFAATDTAITEQPMGRAQNEDIVDIKNTVLKMAKKRAKVDAVLGATRSSALFTQDMEDMPHPPAPEPPKAATPPPASRPEPPKPAPKPAPAKAAAAAKPVGPPKANIPVSAPTKPPVSKEPPKRAADFVPEAGGEAFAEAAAPKVTKTRQERARAAVDKIGCSTTNLTAFICRTLGVDAEAVRKVPINRIEAVVWALEQTIEKFATKPQLELVGNLVRDEEIDSSVKSYFTMAFAKADKP